MSIFLSPRFHSMAFYTFDGPKDRRGVRHQFFGGRFDTAEIEDGDERKRAELRLEQLIGTPGSGIQKEEDFGMRYSCAMCGVSFDTVARFNGHRGSKAHKSVEQIAAESDRDPAALRASGASAELDAQREAIEA